MTVADGLSPQLLRRFEEILTPARVVTDPEILSGYAVDWTGRFRGSTPAVVRPASSAEVAGVLTACREEGTALVVQGGNTGLVGGGVPLGGQVVLSLTGLGGSVEVDALAGQATAPAGATVEALQRAAAGADWAYGVDFASRGSATVGGSIATNAGGLRLLRHGDTRAQLLGVEAVLGSGQVVSHLGGLLKDNTGYRFDGLLCGSEGTLGVVTAARLRLVAPAPLRVVALLAFADAGAAVRAALELRRAVPTLEAAELFLRAGLSLVMEHTGLPAPFDRAHDAYLLVEAAGTDDPSPVLAEGIDALVGVTGSAVATDSLRAEQLWRYREAHTESINARGIPHKLDVSVAPAALGTLVSALPGIVRAVDPVAETWLFGHAADGNVHVNVTGVAPDDERVDDAVFRHVASLGGSISAEHGIGVAKRRWLHLNRTAEEISAFRAVKRALDPEGILGPGVLLPEPGFDGASP